MNLEFGGLLPEWILIKEAANKQKQSELEEQLDRDEASSIALALELENATLIIDETKGRKIAQSYDINMSSVYKAFLPLNPLKGTFTNC